jgi:hypothetical protein
MPQHVMNYIECEAPAGLTLAQWRRSHTRIPARRRLRLRGLLRGHRRPA